MDLINLLSEKNSGLNAVLNNLSEGIMIIDREEKIIFVNEKGEIILKKNYPSKAAVRNPTEIGLFQVNQRHLLRKEEMPIIQALNGNNISDQRVYLKSPSQSEGIYLSVDAFQLREGKEVVGAMAIFRDITDMLSRERKINEERAFFQRLLDLIPGYVLIKDMEGKYIFVNKHFKDNYPGLTLEGKYADEVFPDLQDLIREETETVIRTGRTVENLVDLTLPDGKIHVLRTILFPNIDSDGKLSGTCLLAFDETQKIEDQKAIQAERVKSINASKLAAIGTLAAEIGHEINNPLGIIKTSLMIMKKMLSSGKGPEAISQQIEVIDSTTMRITDIVKALKHISRDSSNEKFSRTTIAEILNDSHALCVTKFKLKRVGLHIDKSKISQSEEIDCLRVQLSQVFLNLLMNACDAAEGSQDAWVKIEVSRSDDYFFFKVTDSGPGVPEHARKKLFEPFFTTKEHGSGTGLGLSISRDIMRRHSGDVFLDLDEGPNCFVVKLPRRQAVHSV